MNHNRFWRPGPDERPPRPPDDSKIIEHASRLRLDCYRDIDGDYHFQFQIDGTFGLGSDGQTPEEFERVQRDGRQWPSLNRHLRAILRRAGFTPGPKDGFHKFRRTLATVITEKLGIEEARKQLGHSSIAVTKGYIDPSKLSIVHPIDLLPPLPAPGRKRGQA